jgi:hypothetical protein
MTRCHLSHHFGSTSRATWCSVGSRALGWADCLLSGLALAASGLRGSGCPSTIWQDLIAPAASVDPLSAAFHAAARAERKFQEVFDLDLPAWFRDRQRAKAGLYWCSIGGGPFAHYSLGGASRHCRDARYRRKEGRRRRASWEIRPRRPRPDHPVHQVTIGHRCRTSLVYRHRQVAAVRGRVQFWRQDGDLYIPCPPPWDWPGEVGAAWMTYVPTRVYIDADYPTQFTQQP